MNWIERIKFASQIVFGRAAIHSEIISDYIAQHGASNPDPQAAFLQAYRQVQWVYTCVYAITSFAAMCPLKLYRRKPGQKREEWEELPYDHPGYALINRPNPQAVQYQFVERLLGFMELGGTGFILKEDFNKVKTEYRPPPKELWVVRPDRITEIIPNKDGTIKGYKVGYGAKALVYPPEKMVCIPYFNPYDDHWGQGSLQAVQRSVISDISAQDYNKSFLQNEAIPATLLVAKGGLTDPQRKIFLASWDKMHRGPKKRGRTALVDGDIEIKRLAESIKDMDYTGLRTMSRDEILASFGVPKGLLGLDVANRSVVEMQERQFAYRTMIPKLTFLAQCQTEYIYKDFGPDIVAEYDYSDVPALKEDADAKATRAVSLVNAGIKLINEVRQGDYGLEPVPWGNTWYIPMTMVPVEDSGGLLMSKPPGEAQKSRALPVYTPAQEKRLLMYERRFTKTEREGTRLLKAMFDEQAKHALKELKRAHEARDIWDTIDDEFLAASTEKTVRQVLLLAIEQGILHGKDLLEFIEIDFTLKNPRLVKWLENESMKQVKLVNDTTKAMLKTAQKEMAQMVAEGKPLSEIARVIDKAFDGRRNNAATIARTEVQQGIQTTQELMWQESPVVSGKTWLASFHPEGRHNGMHGQTVPVDGVFVQVEGDNAGQTASHPGGFGIAGEDINCLCDMAPEVTAKALNEYTWRAVDAACDKLERRLYPAKGKGSQSWERKEKIRKLCATA